MEEKLRKVKKDLIIDEFILDNTKIVLLNPKFLGKDTDPDTIVLAKVVYEEGEQILRALTDEEYDKAFKKYELLLEIMEEDNG